MLAYLRHWPLYREAANPASLAESPLCDKSEGRKADCSELGCMVEFAADSALEEAGFEPSVPRGAIKVSRGAHVVSAGFPANGKVGANENRHHDDAPRPPRDR